MLSLRWCLSMSECTKTIDLWLYLTARICDLGGSLTGLFSSSYRKCYLPHSAKQILHPCQIIRSSFVVEKIHITLAEIDVLKRRGKIVAIFRLNSNVLHSLYSFVDAITPVTVFMVDKHVATFGAGWYALIKHTNAAAPV